MLDRLKVALALAATLNFHRAVQRLKISQPQLVRIIISLEQDLGIIFLNAARVASSSPQIVRAH